MSPKKKAFLLLMLALLAVATVPALRTRAAPVLEPATTVVVDVTGPLLYDVRDRIYAWDTRKELNRFLDELIQMSIAREPMPVPQRFTRWILEETTSDGFDRWGTAYYILQVGDSVIVGSAGPDLEPNNADDIREGFAKSRT